MMRDRKLTVEELTQVAAQAREEGYTELADTLDGITTKVARFNEQSKSTLQEIRERMGEEKFWKLWKELSES